MADPWAEFIPQSAPQQSAGADPWAEFMAPSMSAGEKAIDAYKGLGTGTLKGSLTLGGMAGDLSNLLAKGSQAATDFIADKTGIDPGPRAAETVLPTSKSLTKNLTDALGEDFYKPKSDYGKAAENVGEFIPGAVASLLSGGGSLAGNVARYAVAPGAATFAAEKYLPETEYKPYLVAGAGVGASLTNPSRIISPLEATPAKQAAVAALEREGVTSLTAGQRTGSKPLQYLESAASHAPGAGGGATRIEHEGQQQFTEAALRRAGTGAEATPEVLAANQQRLGQAFQDLSGRNTLVPDNQFITDLTDAVRQYRNVPDSQQRAIVQGYINDIVPHVNAGGMPGTEYQPMRSMLSKQAKSVANNDPYLSQALGGIRNALDSAMMRSMSPEDQALWQTTRREYGAQKVIEKAASRAGEATAEGQITPANLRNTVAAENRGGYARGEGQFNELARAGVSVMTPLPNSGTAQRTNAFHLLNAGLLGIPQAAAGRVVMSRPVQSYLANQLMTGRLPTNPAARDLLMIEALQRSQQPAIEAK